MPREYLFFIRALASAFLSVLALSAQSFTPIRVNSGGDQYVDSQGVVWAADNGFIGAASRESTAMGITGTLSPGIYQSGRFARVILYSFSVPNGTYTVNLRFAEIHWTMAGQRIFSVAINNRWVLANFDLIAQAGGPYRALDKPFTITVTGGGTKVLNPSTSKVTV